MPELDGLAGFAGFTGFVDLKALVQEFISNPMLRSTQGRMAAIGQMFKNHMDAPPVVDSSSMFKRMNQVNY
jgi:hypothetical protein